jgi:hypothetical protein
MPASGFATDKAGRETSSLRNERRITPSAGKPRPALRTGTQAPSSVFRSLGSAAAGAMPASLAGDASGSAGC